MGHFVEFHCRFCHYQEAEIGVGHGRSAFPFLKLYRCDHCKTIGSTWVYEDKLPHCAGCYHATITLLDDDATRVSCPKCGEAGRLTRKDGEWQ